MKGFFAVATILCAFAQHVSARNIPILIHDIPEKVSYTLYLSYFEKDSYQLTDSLKITSSDSLYSFSIPDDLTDGLMQIFSAVDENKVEFLFNSHENIELEASYWGLKNGDILTYNSAENKAYSLLLQLSQQYTRLYNQLRDEKEGLSPFQNDYRRRWGNIESKIEILQLELNGKLDSIGTRYPKTYTAEVLIPLTRVPVRPQEMVLLYDGYLSFLNQHFFDFVDFNDARMLRHYAFIDKVFYYLTEFTDKNEEGTKRGLDYLLSLLQEDQEINSLVFNNLMETFIDLGSEVFTLYLVNNAKHGCSLNLDFADLKKLRSIEALSIGGTAPDILLYDTKHKAQSLYENCRKNELTILYVWVSWCAHCQKTTPRLKETYGKYRKKGLGVFAVSLDEKEEDWLGAIAEYQTEWLNTAELVPIRQSKVAPLYNISTTPAIFVLDSKGTVLARNLFGEELDQWLQEYFSGH